MVGEIGENGGGSLATLEVCLTETARGTTL